MSDHRTRQQPGTPALDREAANYRNESDRAEIAAPSAASDPHGSDCYSAHDMATQAGDAWRFAIDAVIAEWEKPWGQCGGRSFGDRLRAMRDGVSDA